MEFLLIAGLHLVAVASPGPDFAVVSREALRSGFPLGVCVAAGVGAGIMLHVAYSILGIGLMIKTSPVLFSALRVLCAVYLLWLSWQIAAGLWRCKREAGSESGSGSAPVLVDVPASSTSGTVKQSSLARCYRAFVKGFLTNGMNPKATLFFLSLFTGVISTHTPVWVQVGYGGYLSIMTFLWFVMIARLFSRNSVQAWYQRQAVWVDSSCALFFVGFAVFLVWPLLWS